VGCHSITGVFGGRITKETEQRVLDALVEHLFTSNCFDVNFKLVGVEGGPTLPDGTLAYEIFSWIESLSSHTPPTWIGLDNEAEAVREQKIAESVERKVGIVGALVVMDGVYFDSQIQNMRITARRHFHTFIVGYLRSSSTTTLCSTDVAPDFPVMVLSFCLWYCSSCIGLLCPGGPYPCNSFQEVLRLAHHALP
jgi:hypothetical protein